MARRLATPGVYVEEKNAFAQSVVSVPTAVPAFIGFTEKVQADGKDLLLQPTRVSSLEDFINLFGAAWTPDYTLEKVEEAADLNAGDNNYKLSTDQPRFYLFDSLRLFFANGGGVAYIVSAGTYEEEGTVVAPDSEKLTKGIDALKTTDEPTIVVIPDSMALKESAAMAVQQAMLLHCEQLKNRFSILDVFDGFKPRTYDAEDVIDRFRDGISKVGLMHGAAYYPWVDASVVTEKEFSYQNIENVDALVEAIKAQAESTVSNERKLEEIKREADKLLDASEFDADIHRTLLAVSPFYAKLLEKIADDLNVLPPSGAIAGVYARVDDNKGVWKAPANVGAVAVSSPIVNLTNEDQEDLNVTVSGKSINAIRKFVGEGTLVWGARTLDGNSQDWRYVNVRRTMTFIEQSVKKSIRAYVFEPNVLTTWLSVKSSIDSFLNDLWSQGALVGKTPAEGYIVDVGLGATMTPNDILDGVMKVTVKVAISRPAEFIVITFQQKMQES